MIHCTAKLKSSFDAGYKNKIWSFRDGQESICRGVPESGITGCAALKLMTTATKEQAMKNEYVKKILIAVLEAVVLLIAFDLIILFTSLAQVALEGKTGYWNPFWRVQAEFVIKLLLTK